MPGQCPRGGGGIAPTLNAILHTILQQQSRIYPESGAAERAHAHRRQKKGDARCYCHEYVPHKQGAEGARSAALQKWTPVQMHAIYELCTYKRELASIDWDTGGITCSESKTFYVFGNDVHHEIDIVRL